MTKKKSISMQDIADALKVSKTTISWILSGQGKAKGFSDATIKEVIDYANMLNYHPNLLARSLSTGSTNTIGLIIPFIDDTFYSEISQAIERETRKNNYVLTICSSEGNSVKEMELIYMLISKQVDGLIIAPTRDSMAAIKKMKRDSFPFVLVDRFFPELNTNYVIVDNEQSSYTLVKYMIEKGSRKIAILTSDSQLLVMRFRLEGYKKALADSKIPEQDGLCVEVQRDNYQEDIVVQLDRLFKEFPDVDGLFFATHYLALEALRYFINKGIDYEKRFRLACFHETVALDILAPRMSISQMPIDQIGKNAVDVLIKNINDKDFKVTEKVLKNIFLPNEVKKTV